MNTKNVLWGLGFIVAGILTIIWVIKDPEYNKDDDDGSIESGGWQWINKNKDQEGILVGSACIIGGIVKLIAGLTNTDL